MTNVKKFLLWSHLRIIFKKMKVYFLRVMVTAGNLFEILQYSSFYNFLVALDWKEKSSFLHIFVNSFLGGSRMD